MVSSAVNLSMSALSSTWAPAAGIDEGGIRLQAEDEVAAQHPHRLRVVGKVVGDDVAFGEHLRKRNQTDAQLGGTGRGHGDGKDIDVQFGTAAGRR